jgi:hypothetical protein
VPAAAAGAAGGEPAWPPAAAAFGSSFAAGAPATPPCSWRPERSVEGLGEIICFSNFCWKCDVQKPHIIFSNIAPEDVSIFNGFSLILILEED